jgi:hypothetical protein
VHCGPLFNLGNLASLLVERGNLEDALVVLDEGTRLDDESDNLRGLVVKRGIRGQILQKKVLPSALILDPDTVCSRVPF